MERDTEGATTIDAEARIKEFLTSQFLFDFDDRVTEDTNLLKEGLIDSFGYLQLVQFLEKEFQIKLEDEELISYQVSTLRIAVAKVEKKLSESK